jgi:hypothetical protein
MLSQEYFTHYPSRLLWTGGSVLCLFVILSGSLLLPVAGQPAFPLPPRKTSGIAAPQTIVPLEIEKTDRGLIWEMPPIQDEMVISLSEPRPGLESLRSVAHVRLKTAQQSRRIPLPSRIYLCFNDQGVLCFQDEKGPFWVDLSCEAKDNLIASVMVVIDNVEVQQAIFSRRADPTPLQKAEEFSSGSPQRILGEARWWGADLVSGLAASAPKQRLEIGSTVLELGESDWIAWTGGKWSKIDSPFVCRDMPIARIRSVTAQVLEWDVWDSSHTRFAAALQSAPAIHFKSEEWMSSLRIRSDKQVSCTIEKQSFILRQGDWVLKENGHWRVLRKPEDRQQLMEGFRTGDLFILEKIDNKQKNIKGKLFFANRTQILAIEASASNTKHDKKHLASPGSHRPRKVKSV